MCHYLKHTPDVHCDILFRLTRTRVNRLEPQWMGAALNQLSDRHFPMRDTTHRQPRAIRVVEPPSPKGVSVVRRITSSRVSLADLQASPSILTPPARSYFYYWPSFSDKEGVVQKNFTVR